MSNNKIVGYWSSISQKVLEISKICNKRVLLDFPKDSEKDIYFQWINNKELVEFSSDFKEISYESHCNWWSSLNITSEKLALSIYLKENLELIGSCSLNNINYTYRNAELRIRIGNMSKLGKGYGSDAIEILKKIAFSELDLIRLYLYVFSDNIRAIKCYLKCGFVEEGEMKKAAIVGNRYKDIKIMACLNIKD
jgi:RimJ/RimL family protein N-acetyltransferase